jgi:hypothetical protein
MRRSSITTAALAATACGVLTEPLAPEDYTCNGVTRDELTLQYEKEVVELALSGECDAFREEPDYPDACPAYAEVNARHEKRREEWRECKK